MSGKRIVSRQEHCDHVILVLERELAVELGDGRTYTLKSGESFQVADDASSHRLSSEPGARVFVVD